MTKNHNRRPNQERDHTWLVKDPLLEFVLDGVKYAVKQDTMTWQEARDNIKIWFPEAEIVLRPEQQAE